MRLADTIADELKDWSQPVRIRYDQELEVIEVQELGGVIPKADTLELRWCTTHESQVTWWPFTDPVESRRCKWWQHLSDPSDCNIVSARLWTEEP